MVAVVESSLSWLRSFARRRCRLARCTLLWAEEVKRQRPRPEAPPNKTCAQALTSEAKQSVHRGDPLKGDAHARVTRPGRGMTTTP
jgi:hypothetical protein